MSSQMHADNDSRAGHTALLGGGGTEPGNKEDVMECVTGCWWRGGLTSVIIFPLVLFRSLWLARFSFCWSTRSLVVRYSRANSLRILLKR